ncbi:MAG: hypothetical protein M3010_10855, partial [Candidatus Dormibacteraeota bacterium]|nr:hypothetical protein [Candidatus Dormibacteraeota bacterium]
IEFDPTGDRDADVAALAQVIMDRFEPELLRHPEQWYLFSPMWLRETAPPTPGRETENSPGQGALAAP